MTDAEFADLLAAARAGAPWACVRLYEELKRPVLAYVSLRGVADPDDVTSEVFLNVFRGLDRFDGDLTGFRAWVFTIARRRVRDSWRTRARRVDEAALPDHVEPVGGDVEAEALARLGLGHYAPALAALTPEQREVIVLRIVADLPVEQVAATMGRSVPAVKALQHRALNALRRLLPTPPASSSPAAAIPDPR